MKNILSKLISLWLLLILISSMNLYAIKLSDNKVAFNTLNKRELIYDWREIHKTIKSTKLYAQAIQLDGHTSLSSLEKEYILVENFKTHNILKRLKSKTIQKSIYAIYILLKIQLHTQNKFAIDHLNKLLSIKFKDLLKLKYSIKQTNNKINDIKRITFNEFLIDKLKFSYKKIDNNLLNQLTQFYLSPSQANLSKITVKFDQLTRKAVTNKQAAMKLNHALNVTTLPLLNKVKPIIDTMKNYYYYLGNTNKFPIVYK